MDDMQNEPHKNEKDDVEKAAIARKGSPYLTTKQAAHYLGLSPRTLEKMRSKGVGPRFHLIGLRSKRYLVRELDKWSTGDCV